MNLASEENVKKSYGNFDSEIQIGLTSVVNVCTGDAGSPLIGQKDGVWYQTGIASFGPKNCSKEHPFVFTKVSYFYDWIYYHLKE